MKIKLFTRKSDELYYRQQGIERFIDAQKTDYKIALAEIQRGRKQSHWIWYIFPQLVGLGRSCYSTLYGIRGREEAEEYLQNEVLGRRLREITNALLKHNDKSAEEIFGGLDAMKVRSSMTPCSMRFRLTTSSRKSWIRSMTGNAASSHCRQSRTKLYSAL